MMKTFKAFLLIASFGSIGGAAALSFLDHDYQAANTCLFFACSAAFFHIHLTNNSK